MAHLPTTNPLQPNREPAKRTISVLVVDDSADMRYAIGTRAFDAPDVRVIDTARDGEEAQAGDPLRQGLALIVPGDCHLVVQDDSRVGLTRTDRVHGVRPAVDVTLVSACRRFGRRTVAIILTGDEPPRSAAHARRPGLCRRAREVGRHSVGSARYARRTATD